MPTQALYVDTKLGPYVALLGADNCWGVERDAKRYDGPHNGIYHPPCGPYLAQCIVDAGPQSGRWATNAIPGLSWHQWGLALDSYWLVDGAAEWDADATHNGVQGYAVYAEEAERLGLRSLRSIGDSPHVQQPKEGSPSSMGLVAVDAAMRERWGA